MPQETAVKELVEGSALVMPCPLFIKHNTNASLLKVFNECYNASMLYLSCASIKLFGQFSFGLSLLIACDYNHTMNIYFEGVATCSLGMGYMVLF